MYKVVVSSGCSFAHGFGLENRDDKYSSLLSKYLDTSLIDVSVSGSSNENIAAATVYGINQALKIADPSEILVVVGWTEISRVEYWNTKIARLQSAFMLSENHGFSATDRLTNTTFITKFVRENMYEPCYTYYKLLHAFNYVYNTCKAYNIKLINLQNLTLIKARMPSGVIINSGMRAENYTADVVSSEVSDAFNSMFRSRSFLQLIFEAEDYRLPLDAHPSALGHRVWFETIAERHKDILK